MLISILRVLTAVVSYISSILILDAAFLIMAVKILNVQRITSLVVAKLTGGPRLQGLVLGSCPPLSVKMLSQVIVRGFHLGYYLTTSPSLIIDLAMGLI